MSIKNMIYKLRVLHGRILDWRTCFLPLFYESKRKRDAVYLVMTPEHGNLGDHAIAQSEIDLLNKLNISFVEITDKQCKKLRDINRLNFMNGRTILISGGGNLGTLWPNVDALMQDIVVNNYESQIVMFPNTVFYGETVEDKLKLEASKMRYNSHPHLKMYAREKTSFHFMMSVYRNVALAPDMVLRLDKHETSNKRAGCLLCLRSDRERTRTQEQEIVLRQQISNIFEDKVIERDMVLDGEISKSDRYAALERQYDYFRRSELVVTDRLHGMIFSVITGTPCIVINSKSPKVRGCYEWIENLDYIRFCEEMKDISCIYSEMNKTNNDYSVNKIDQYYGELINDLLFVSNK